MNVVISDTTEFPQSIIPANSTDDMVIDMWLHGKSKNTKQAYTRDIKDFLSYVAVPLKRVTLLHLQQFQDSLSDLKKSSANRRMNAVKSLLTFCQKTGYLALNVGSALDVKKSPSKLAERILTEEQIMKLFIFEKDQQHAAILRVLYYAGLRVSEICNLNWSNIVPNGECGQINVWESKGDKSRHITIPLQVYQDLLALRASALDDAPVFVSRVETRLDRTQVFRIVKQAAKRAGLPKGTSPHWLRHAHATHALNRGAPIQLVKETLGHSNIIVTDQYLHARPGESSATYLPI